VREAAYFSRGRLAAAAKIGRGTLRRLEQGGGDLSRYRKVAAVLGVEIRARGVQGDPVAIILRAARRRRQLSRAAVAKFIRASAATVQRLERGMSVTVRVLEAYAHCMGVELYLGKK